MTDEGVARRIIVALKEQIHAGVYQPGDRLPSTRAFAAEWGASRTTVTAAYGQLIAEGYLTSRRGARAVVAQGLGAAATPTPSPAATPRHLSTFAQRLLALPPPAIARTPLRPEHQLAHDKQRPALADKVERVSRPAGVLVAAAGRR